MKNLSKVFVVFLIALSVASGTGTAVGAGAYPDKPITVIIPSGPGGGADIFGRVHSAAFEKGKLLPQPLIVENKAGGSGGIAAAYVAGKRKDPYFLLTTTNSILTTPLMGLTPVSFEGNFTPIAGFAFDEYVLFVVANSKYQSLKDIIADAKANPKKITVGGTQVGTGNHICTHLIEKATGVQLSYVGFNGMGEVSAAVLGGHISFAFANPAELMALYQGGKIRLISIASEKRNAGLPNVPTFKEQGVDGVYIVARGIVAPAEIPQDAQKILEGAFLKSYNSETFKKYCTDNFLAQEWMDSPAYAKFMAKENLFYTRILTEMGLVKKK